jgi:hypothetical protein
MGEHTDNIESYLSGTSGRELRDSELYARWFEEDPTRGTIAKRNDRDLYEQFKNSGQAWDDWSTNEVSEMENETQAAKTLASEINALQTRETTKPPPGVTAEDAKFAEDLQRLRESRGLDKPPEFMIAEGLKTNSYALAERRWQELQDQCAGEVTRSADRLEKVWNDVTQQTLAQLQQDQNDWARLVQPDSPDPLFSDEEIGNLRSSMYNIGTELQNWTQRLFQNSLPDRNTLLNLARTTTHGEFLKAHGAVLERIDGAKYPIAAYRVVATLRAIEEFQVQQMRNRSNPPLYSKMLDRMNEIPGRQPVTPSVSDQFLKSGTDYDAPDRTFERVIEIARSNSYEPTKVDPDFQQRFRAMLSGIGEMPRDNRPAINFQTGMKNLQNALKDWSNEKIKWPASATKFAIAHRIATSVEIMKQAIDDGLYGTTKEAIAVRANLQTVLDGVTERIATELNALQ